MDAATMTAPARIHPFELAGLGRAPFRFVGYERAVYQACPGAPVQPGGSCAFCGTGLYHVYRVRSADDRVFGVGCDCVVRVWPAAWEEMRKARRAEERYQRELACREAAERRASSRVAEIAAERAAQAEVNADQLAMVLAGLDVALSWEFLSEFDSRILATAARELSDGHRAGVTEFEWDILARAYLAAMLPESTHFGEVGKRVRKIVARYEGGPIIGEFSPYGPSVLAKFRDLETGALLVWKTASFCRREIDSVKPRAVTCVGDYTAPIYPGTVVTLTGTVKAHTEYRGEKQTGLARCKVEAA